MNVKRETIKWKGAMYNSHRKVPKIYLQKINE